MQGCSLAHLAMRNGDILICCEVLAMTESATNRWTHPAAILVATDLSDLDRLMPFALDQAASTGARLILMHAVSAAKAVAEDAIGLPYFDPGGAIDFAANSLETWCELARSRSLSCNAIFREG